MNVEPANAFNQINNFGEQLLDSSLETFNSRSQKKTSGCPFMISSVNDPLKTKFDFHYEIGVMIHHYDFFFDALNYSNEQLKLSKQILSMPKHLRNTLFIRHEKIKEIRRLDFSTIYIIAEEIKEKSNDLYNKEQYQQALGQYNMIYSMFKWIEFTDKDKEERLFKNSSEISNQPIIDSDIVSKGCKVQNKTQYELESFRSSMTFLLKAMSYCYIHLQLYSEAIKCLNEALEYSDDTKPDIYFRRAQARMFNKYSSREMLLTALDDFKKAIQRKPGEKMIEDHYKILKELIKAKEEMESALIKTFCLELLRNFSYAYTVIKKKNLKLADTFHKNYEMNHLNYKIMQEMEEAYYYALKHFKKNRNETEYAKGIKEFEEFLDGFIQYKQSYDLNINKMPKWLFDSLTQTEKEDLSLIISSESLYSLFEDFKYKRCDELYMEMKFNQGIWEKCFTIVNEKEKLNLDTIYSGQGYKDLLQKGIKLIVDLFKINNQFQFYFGSCILLVFSVLIIMPQIYSYAT